MLNQPTSQSFAHTSYRALRIIRAAKRAILRRASPIVFIALGGLGIGLVAAGTAQAATTHVDGISDQSLPNWDNGFGSSYFAGFFHTDWVSSSHIQYARYVVQWNVISKGGGERSTFENWLNDAAGMGLTIDVALTSYNGVYPGSSSEYKTDLKELLNQAKAMGHAIRYLEAWNEPNNQGNETTVAAAHFTNSAYSACEEGYGCTVIAGDVEDNSGAKKYEEEYRANLNPVPAIWGLHPYYSVEYMTESYYAKAVEGLPGGGSGDQLWITEVAARKCTDYNEHLVENGESGQAERAKWLVDTLIPTAAHKPEHVFYYEFMLGGHKQPSCTSESEDDALYVPSPDPNAEDAPRLAAGYIFDGKDVAWGYTGAPSGVATPNATVTGSVYPGSKLEAKYHFEYGTSTSYGEDSGEGSAAPGVGGAAVSEPLGKLAAGTTYHYRLVAWNTEGSITYGIDRTFHTQPPPEATTEPATAIAETQAVLHGTVNPEGLSTTYYFEYGTSPSFGYRTESEPVGSGEGPVGASPAVISQLSKATVYYFRLVAVSSAGAMPGGTQTLETGGTESVFYDGTGILQESAYAAQSWSNTPLGGGAVSGAIAAAESSTGERLAFYNYGGILQQATESDANWHYVPLGVPITGDPAVVATSTGEPFVFYEYNEALQETWYHGGKPLSAPVGHAMTSDPAVVMSASGEQFVFFNDAGTLDEMSWNGKAWNPDALGDAITGKPAVVMSASGEQFVFFNSGGALEETTYREGKWSLAAPVGHAITGDPVVLMSSGGEQFVFFNDAGTLDEMSWNGKAWNPDALGNAISGDPAAVMSASGEQFVFFNSGGWLDETRYHEGKWLPAELGHPITGGPAVVMRGTGEQVVLYAFNGLLQEAIYSDSEWHYYPRGHGVITSDPAAVVSSAGAPAVFYEYNEALQETWYDEGQWLSSPVGHAMTSDPAVVMSASGEQFVFFNDAGTLDEMSWNGKAWNADPLDDAITGKPAVVMSASGEQFVFFNSGGALEETTYREGKWSLAAPVGHAITGNPVVLMSSDGEQFVFFNDAGVLDEMSWNGKAWNPDAVGNVITGDPAAVMSASGEQFLFFNSGGWLDETHYHEGKWLPAELEHPITGGPAAMMSPLGEQFVFYNHSNTLQESWWNGSSWSYDPAGEPITGTPAVALNPVGHAG
jgi:hypothetical protein